MSLAQLVRGRYHPLSTRIGTASSQLVPIAIVIALLVGLVLKLVTSWPLERAPSPDDSSRPEVTGPYV